MQSKAEDTLSAIFRETEDFISKLDPKRCSPPFITNTFLPLRSKAYARFNDSESRSRDIGDKLMKFIEKFELDYIEALRNKLRDKYTDYIQQKKYNMPSEVNLKQLKDFGAVEEVNQLTCIVAEWSLELEILAYTIEGLKLYGLQDFQGVEKKDYISSLKRGYTYSKKASFQSMSEYLLRKAASFTLAKFSSLALMRGVTKIQLGIGTILEIFFMFSMTSQVPWALIIEYLNLPWLLGGVACSLALNKLNDYVVKDETLSNMKQVYSTFENNKLYLMSERKSLVDLVLKIVNKSPEERSQIDIKKLGKVVETLLNPNEDVESTEQVNEEAEKLFNVKDQEDFVLVEDKDHKEVVDDSGVLIVDW